MDKLEGQRQNDLSRGAVCITVKKVLKSYPTIHSWKKWPDFEDGKSEATKPLQLVCLLEGRLILM